jgi:hypothetical protein
MKLSPRSIVGSWSIRCAGRRSAPRRSDFASPRVTLRLKSRYGGAISRSGPCGSPGATACGIDGPLRAPEQESSRSGPACGEPWSGHRGRATRRARRREPPRRRSFRFSCVAWCFPPPVLSCWPAIPTLKSPITTPEKSSRPRRRGARQRQAVGDPAGSTSSGALPTAFGFAPIQVVFSASSSALFSAPQRGHVKGFAGAALKGRSGCTRRTSRYRLVSLSSRPGTSSGTARMKKFERARSRCVLLRVLAREGNILDCWGASKPVRHVG